MPSEKHYAFIDIVRAAACFLVVLLHTSALQFDHFFSGWKIALVYNSLTRMSVALFFMLSGFLLLDNSISSLTHFYYKRYIRILLPFFAICILYYFTPDYSAYSVWGYIRQIGSHFVDYHLWYVYSIIGLYFALPFFIKMIHGDSGRKLAWLYICVWAFCFCLIPTLMAFSDVPPEVLDFQQRYPMVAFSWILQDLFSSLSMNFNFLFFYGFMGYLLCAWLIKHSALPKTLPFALLCLALYICATIAIIIFTITRSEALGEPNQLFFYHLSPFVLIQAIGIFLFFRHFTTESRFIRDLSDKSYWTYLLHILILRFFISISPIPYSRVNVILIPAYAVAIFLTAYCAAIPLRTLELRLLRWLKIS